jgi:hypothetical protein
MKKTGSNLMSMLNSMNSATTSMNNGVRRRRMRGPNINMDELPDVADTQS